MVEATIKIEGKVHGVFFRAEAAEKARQLNVTGWVKNDDDGSMTCLAQGEKTDVEQLIEWCKKGPSLARVTAVKTTWNSNPENPYRDFSIYLL